jgi:hypothetical protein
MSELLLRQAGALGGRIAAGACTHQLVAALLATDKAPAPLKR